MHYKEIDDDLLLPEHIKNLSGQIFENFFASIAKSLMYKKYVSVSDFEKSALRVSK